MTTDAARLNKEFLHHLQDTAILLGANYWTVDAIDRLSRGEISDSDSLHIRGINYELICATKRKLADCHRISVTVCDEPKIDDLD